LEDQLCLRRHVPFYESTAGGVLGDLPAEIHKLSGANENGPTGAAILSVVTLSLAMSFTPMPYRVEGGSVAYQADRNARFTSAIRFSSRL